MAARQKDTQTKPRRRTQRKTAFHVPVALAVAAAGLVAIALTLSYVGFFHAQRSPGKQTLAETNEPAAPFPAPSADNPQQGAPLATRAIVARSEPPSPPSPPPRPPVQSRSMIAQRDAELDGWFVKSYLRCWTPPSTVPGGKYAAEIRVVHKADGSLAGAPVLVNPPMDPEWRAYADSAVRAVKKCNPLQVPAQYLSRFDQWRKITLNFAPDGA